MNCYGSTIILNEQLKFQLSSQGKKLYKDIKEQLKKSKSEIASVKFIKADSNNNEIYIKKQAEIIKKYFNNAIISNIFTETVNFNSGYVNSGGYVVSTGAPVTTAYCNICGIKGNYVYNICIESSDYFLAYIRFFRECNINEASYTKDIVEKAFSIADKDFRLVFSPNKINYESIEKLLAKNINSNFCTEMEKYIKLKHPDMKIEIKESKFSKKKSIKFIS